MKIADSNDEKKSEKDENKENETGDKHEKVHSKPKVTNEMNSFEKQERIRQEIEDMVDKQGLI